jgi:hypothetical protein
MITFKCFEYLKHLSKSSRDCEPLSSDDLFIFFNLLFVHHYFVTLSLPDIAKKISKTSKFGIKIRNLTIFEQSSLR